ncbi:MAG: hypothetical protein Q4E57_03105 [Eubacteriales bacterium]|nr:hypothetical protein [Eubacteriales bacterium]
MKLADNVKNKNGNPSARLNADTKAKKEKPKMTEEEAKAMLTVPKTVSLLFAAIAGILTLMANAFSAYMYYMQYTFDAGTTGEGAAAGAATAGAGIFLTELPYILNMIAALLIIGAALFKMIIRRSGKEEVKKTRLMTIVIAAIIIVSACISLATGSLDLGKTIAFVAPSVIATALIYFAAMM